MFGVTVQSHALNQSAPWRNMGELEPSSAPPTQHRTKGAHLSFRGYIDLDTPYATVPAQLEHHSQTQRGTLWFGWLCLSSVFSVPPQLPCGLLSASNPLGLGRLTQQVHTSRRLCSAETADRIWDWGGGLP